MDKINIDDKDLVIIVIGISMIAAMFVIPSDQIADVLKLGMATLGGLAVGRKLQ